ncbi:MAG: ABC transporter permease [Dehalococcoidia bacterium]
MAGQQVAVTPAAIRSTRHPGFWGMAWRRMRRNRLATFSAGVIVLFIVVAVLADLIAPHGPYEQFFKRSTEAVIDPLAQRSNGKYEGPSAAHIFGTDELARDIFTRTVIGLRISLGAAFTAIIVVTGIGILVGTISASGPRWVDDLFMRATDIAYAFPDLLLIILLRAAFGNEIFGLRSFLGLDMSVLLLFLAISLTAWPTMARLVRGQLLSLREMEFSTAARAMGAGKSRIAVRHWLPNAAGPVIVEATFLVPRAIFAEAALSFIGLGVPPPAPSLGNLINAHFSFVSVQWTALAFPTLILGVLFVVFQFFGDGLRDALDPRSSHA